MKFSSNSSKDFLKSQAVSRRRRKRRFVRLYLFVLLLVVLIIGIVMLLRLDRLQIRNVVVTGNITTSETEIEEFVNKIIDSNYLFVIPKRNSLIYPADTITASIKGNFLRVAEVSLNTESFEYLNVKITERKAVAKWCNPVDCYVIDDNGYAFSKYDESLSNSLQVGELLAFTGMDESIGSEPLGKNIIPKDMVTKFLELKATIETFGLKAKELEYRSKDEIVFKIDGSGRIILNERRPFEESMNNLKTVLNSDIFKGKLESMDYIDTRFGNKVFYKFKNQDAVSSDGGDTATSASPKGTSTDQGVGAR
jgi:hypothetical protein